MDRSRRAFLRKSGIAVTLAGVAPSLLSSCTNSNSGIPAVGSLQVMTSGVEPLTIVDFENRRERARQLMEDYRIDALFIEGGTNLKYFYNISWWQSERLFGVLLPREGKAKWICPSFELDRAMESIPQGSNIVTWEEHESPYSVLSKACDLGGPGLKNIGLDPNTRNFVSEGFRRDTKAEIKDGSVVTEWCRAIKTDKEIGYLDLANRITKLAYKFAFASLEKGMSTDDVRELIVSGHKAMGVAGSGSPTFGFMSSFPHGTAQKKLLEEGDIIMVDGGCTIEGFRSDVTRTIVFGEPSQKQISVFSAVLNAQKAAQSMTAPGVMAGDLDNAARTIISDAGYGPDYKYFAHRLGHGIGMDTHEFPYLFPGNTMALKRGMVFSNEPGIYIPGEFGIRIEDCFVVKDEGAYMLGGMLTESITDPFGREA